MGKVVLQKSGWYQYALIIRYIRKIWLEQDGLTGEVRKIDDVGEIKNLG